MKADLCKALVGTPMACGDAKDLVGRRRKERCKMSGFPYVSDIFINIAESVKI